MQKWQVRTTRPNQVLIRSNQTLPAEQMQDFDGIAPDYDMAPATQAEEDEIDQVFVHDREMFTRSRWGQQWKTYKKTWKDCKERQMTTWNTIIGTLVDTYLAKQYPRPYPVYPCNEPEPMDTHPDTSGAPDLENTTADSEYTVQVYDLWTLKSELTFTCKPDSVSPAIELMALGYVAKTLKRLSVAISLRMLQLLYQLQQRKASFSIEAFAKVLCDYYSTPYRHHIREVIGDAFEIYLRIIRTVDNRIKHTLGWDSPDWRMKNACHTCGYKQFCQSQHNAEITELLEGLAARCSAQEISSPKMAISDSCCKTRNALTPVIKDVFIGLDVYHFKHRYMVVILNGTRNLHYQDVGRDIVDAILKQHAGDGQPAKYWSKEEQTEHMEAVYSRWFIKGGVWSAVASQAHAEQMRHVRKGCLSRICQELASDDSRIEGSHKGWNSLMHSYASGLENMSHLGHDFVLRHNICCVMRSDKLQQQRSFAASGFGSHHISLTNYLNAQWNQVISHERGRKPGITLTKLPVMQDIPSGESFGIISSACAQTFNGLVKDEDDLASMNLWDEDEIDDVPAEDIVHAMKIDPALLNMPEGRSAATMNILAGPAEATAPFIVNLTEDSEVLTVPSEDHAAVTAPTPTAIQAAATQNSDLIQVSSTIASADVTQPAHHHVNACKVLAVTANLKRKFSATVNLSTSAIQVGDLQASTASISTTANGRSSKRLCVRGRHADAATPARTHEEEESESESGEGENEADRTAEIRREGAQIVAAQTGDVVAKPAQSAVSGSKQTELHSFFASQGKVSNTAQCDSSMQIGLAKTAKPTCNQTAIIGSSGKLQALQLAQQDILKLTQKLPLPNASAGLTRSQAFFTRLTAIDVRALKIDGSSEFFLFMDMREEFQWASFHMNPFKWVRAAHKFNGRLTALNHQNGQGTIRKHLRALVDCLQRVETTVLSRLSRSDFISKSTRSTTFWTRHCHAVPLGKAMSDACSGNTRKKMVCHRCKTLMYLKPSGDPGNHKRDHCADGALLSNKSIPFPQPDGIFSKGKQVHVIPFLRAVQDLYDKICVQGVERSDLDLELDSFATLFLSRTETNKLDGSVVAFRLIPGIDVSEPNAYKDFLFEDNGQQYLRIGCL
ncbi:hypothetical protein NM688_g3185 [Phlebia brevispora]|uniref:Uncharacterized protein n=1 Tax=Phlebia brevispora TaxID=194682 RepID=A0ACC1T752_9APHY|nr:hypothetical protein NM688_g3185 [Phlebia brevispora]